jgi:hypothetical protein
MKFAVCLQGIGFLHAVEANLGEPMSRQLSKPLNLPAPLSVKSMQVCEQDGLLLLGPHGVLNAGDTICL